MESVGSNSPAANTRSAGGDGEGDGDARYSPTPHIAERIIRALHHELRLLHRSGAVFHVLGSTGNVYAVTLSPTPSCTCPDRTVPCKHILFVLLRVLGLSLDDTCVWRRTLRPCQLARLLAAPTAPDVLAGIRARERFRQLFLDPGQLSSDRPRPASELAADGGGVVCPVCLEEIGGGGAVATCGTCGNSLHGECFTRWKRSRGRRGTSCVICRARWRERTEMERYVNLAAYVSSDAGEADGSGGSCAG